jgi:hypothetical protein
MRRRWLITLAAVLAAAGCTAQPPAPVVSNGWREVPAPAAGARVLAIVPDGRGLLVVGSVPGPQGRAPGAWTTTDATTWHAVPLQPHTYYAYQAELVTVGVAGGRVTALGQAFGGAHSNPRMTVWSGDDTGLVEHEQPFEMFGGPHAITVGDAAALPGTALLVGQWDGPTGRYGAAVWTSPDGAAWRRDAADPALASAPGEQTSALGVGTGAAGFLVTGATQQGAQLLPLLWVSPDGRAWRRISLPTLNQAGVEANHVACDGTGCVLAGAAISDNWRAVCWPLTTGLTAGAAHGGPTGDTLAVSQVLLHGNEVLDALRVGGTARLESISRDCMHWREVALPVRSDEVRVGTLPAGLLLATTDETSSRLWLRS